MEREQRSNGGLRRLRARSPVANLARVARALRRRSELAEGEACGGLHLDVALMAAHCRHPKPTGGRERAGGGNAACRESEPEAVRAQATAPHACRVIARAGRAVSGSSGDGVLARTTASTAQCAAAARTTPGSVAASCTV